MATLTVKNVPDALVRRLKQQAALHRRSLNLEVISCLERTSRSVPVDVEAVLARARAVRTAFEGIDMDSALKEAKIQGRS